jgi:LAO/AO transport system kinase
MNVKNLAALNLQGYRDGVLSGDRAVLGRALTLVESTREQDRALAAELLNALLPHTGSGNRIGITGVPGVGKSTFIDAFGEKLIDEGHRVAVLAVDPSSQRTGGSILADKTRMERLARNPKAFIRPSPSAGTLGGVANRTRECMLVCEAAGFDILLIETVGVGQSEVMVAQMTDFFLVLMLAGAGDEIQGIKRGIMEVADCLAVNKADGENLMAAKRAMTTYSSALKFMRGPEDLWQPRALICSGLKEEGLDGIWETVETHRALLEKHGAFAHRRSEQQVQWFERLVDEGLRRWVARAPNAHATLTGLRDQVRNGGISPTSAASRVLEVLSFGEST